MRLVKALALGLSVVGAGANAAPPPPPAYPPGLPSEVDGYRMDAIYPIYHFWLNRQRKEAIVAAVSGPATWHGLKRWNPVVQSEVVAYDYGVVRADRLDRYCAGDWVSQTPSGRCEYRYSYALVPGSPWNDVRINTAIVDSFRPADLARRLSAAGWKQGGNDWPDPKLQGVFAAHVDPEKLFAPLVRTTEVDPASCPALGKAIGALGKVTLDLSPDAILEPVDVMSPHGALTEVRITAADARGRAMTIVAANPLQAKLAPIWTAVENCAPIKD